MNAQPQVIGKYQLLKKIATGGMAEVWFARQSGIAGFRKEVVVKRILPHLADDPEFVRMFLAEARMVARFNHPNIAQIFEFGRDENSGAYYIAMEYVRGEDLGRVMRQAWDREQWISQALAIRVITACCDGLSYAHAATDDQGRPMKIVHRDISPQNILLSFDGGVKLVDFGIAKAADSGNHTQAGAIKGKFLYMSPEQASGKPLDNRSDVFALGLVLYELLTNERPFKRDNEIATLSAALECEIAPPSHVAEIPSELDDVVMRALARSPDDRYPDARAFQMALENLLLDMRWVATSVQLSELMRLLFPQREEEDRQLAMLGDDPAAPTQGFGLGAAPAPSARQRAPSPSTPPVPARPGPAADSEATRVGPSADAGWDAPPGVAGPASGLRRRVSVPDAPPRERVPSRSGARPLPPPAQDVTSDELDSPTQIGASPSGRQVRRSTTTSQAAVRRTSTSGQLQPVRRVTGSGPNVAHRPPPRVSTPPTVDVDRALAAEANAIQPGAGLPRAAPRQAARGGTAGTPAWVTSAFKAVVALSVLSVAGAAAYRYRDEVKPFFGSLFQKVGQAMALTILVDSNLPVDVYVRHAVGEPGAGELQPLGRTPLQEPELVGLHAGDTVVLDDLASGAHYEQEIVQGLPGESVPVRAAFRAPAVKLRIEPVRAAEGCRVARMVGDREIALGPCTKPFPLVDGHHVLAVRLPKMRQPKTVDVDVKSGAPEAPSPLVDLSKFVE